MNCPKCDTKMEYEEVEPDVNVQGGWVCPNCDEFIYDADVDDESDYFRCDLIIIVDFTATDLPPLQSVRRNEHEYHDC